MKRHILSFAFHLVVLGRRGGQAHSELASILSLSIPVLKEQFRDIFSGQNTFGHVLDSALAGRVQNLGFPGRVNSTVCISDRLVELRNSV